MKGAILIATLNVLLFLVSGGAAQGEAHPPREMPAGHGSRALQDSSVADAALEEGKVVAQIRDGSGNPEPGTQVHLLQRRDSVAEGLKETRRTATSDSVGIATFAGLPTGSGYTYMVSVARPPALYASSLFALGRGAGHRVVLHVYDATHAIEETMVAARVLFHLEPASDVIQCSVLLDLMNVGDTTWIPQDVGFRLPEGWKAFEPQSDEGSVGLEVEGDRVEITGSVNPGRHQLFFGFQIPREEPTIAAMRVGLPPRVQSATVRMLSAPSMQLTVDGFPPSEVVTSRSEDRLLQTQIQLPSENIERLDALSIHVAGLPDQGNGRWIALLIALAVAGYGLRIAWTSREVSAGALLARDAGHASELLYSELITLEKAFQRGEVGPSTYRRAKEALVAALSRLNLVAEGSSTRT